MGSRAHHVPRVSPPLGYGLALAGTAALTWLLYAVLRHTHPSNLSLVYLLLVLVLAVVAGSGPAILAALLAFFALDWYFVPPVGHLVTAGPDGWLALLLFLAVAVLTGQLTAGFRNRAAVADRRARELAALYDLSVAILGDAQLEHVLQAIVDRLAATMSAGEAALWLAGADGPLQLAAAAGEPLAGVRLQAHRAAAQGVLDHARSGPEPVCSPGATAVTDVEGVALALGPRVLGALTVARAPGDGQGTADAARLLHAVAGLATLAISRARLAEEEERARQAAASERLKSVFLASVSHDLRTPLTTIRTAAAGLREALGGRPNAALQQLTASIDLEAARLNHLVDNVLAMSRIEAEGLPPNKAPEDLAEIVGTVVHRLRALLAERPLVLRLPDDLPLVPVDAIQIERVIANLVENAVKFSPPESAITVTAWAAEQAVYLRLRNAGEPLGAEERRLIFGKFYRRETTSGSVRGTGLGLAICKAIVEAHGGEIGAEPVPDGVSILVRLPLEPATTAVPLHAGAGR